MTEIEEIPNPQNHLTPQQKTQYIPTQILSPQIQQQTHSPDTEIINTISSSITHKISKTALLNLLSSKKIDSKKTFLPSLAKSQTKIQDQRKVSIPKQSLTTAHYNKQKINSHKKDQITIFKSPVSLHLTNNKEKTLKDEFYLPAFIRNFQLPPKKKIEIIPTMNIFKQRESKIKAFLSPPTMIKKYKILSHIGKGSFSIVSEAINMKTHKKMAIKTYVKFDQIEEYKFSNIEREIQNMLKLNNHKNVVQIEAIIMQKRKIMLVMQNCGQQSLAGILRKRKCLSQIQAKNYFKQIVEGVSFCHSNGICHRDLKLQNILIDQSNSVKIIDFGFSCDTSKLQNSFCGTPPYMAPQIIAHKLYEGKATDIWSIGVILYLMLYGSFPFRSNHQNQLFRLIQNGKIQHNQTVSSEAKQAINLMLKINPSDRATLSQLLTCKWLET